MRVVQRCQQIKIGALYAAPARSLALAFRLNSLKSFVLFLLRSAAGGLNEERGELEELLGQSALTPLGIQVPIIGTRGDSSERS